MAGPRSALTELPAGRVQEMQRRLERRLARAGLSQDSIARVLAVHAHVLLHRLRILENDQHFEMLHPSRTMLVLLDDCDVTDGELLAAAARVESEHAAMRVQSDDPLVRAVPTPEVGETLLEELLAATGEVRIIALAERLDHARHLHLRDRATWQPFHESIGSVYGPLAHRTHPRLARRYDWWTRTFSRRFLGPGTRP